MVMSHLGRPKEGAWSGADSLAPVAARLGELLGREVPLVRDYLDGVDVAPGQVVLLENCRMNVGEKADDEALAKQYARSEEHTSELQSLMRTSYAVFCLKKKKKKNTLIDTPYI